MSDTTKGRNLFHAKVKSVLSGDTLVLASLESGQERLFSLAFVSAPKLQRDGEEVSRSNPLITALGQVMAKSQLNKFVNSHLPSTPGTSCDVQL